MTLFYSSLSCMLHLPGLVATGEKPQKQTGGLVVTKDLMGKILSSTTSSLAHLISFSWRKCFYVIKQFPV